MIRNILIVGAPRSGTSLTAAGFARKGYYVGTVTPEHMRGGDENNPFGYFEADAVIDSSVQVLNRAGFVYHNTWRFDEIGEETIRRIAELPITSEHRKLVEDYEGHRPWMWKDPRLCFTLRYWWKLMDPVTTGVVVVRREFEDIYSSFLRRGWCVRGDEAKVRLSLRLDRHIRAADEAIRAAKIPHLELHYAEFMANPRAVARSLTEFTGADFAAADLNVRPDLNHSSLRGRIASRLRMSLDNGLLRYVKPVKAVVPKSLILALLPEKKYVDRAKRRE